MTSTMRSNGPSTYMVSRIGRATASATRSGALIAMVFVVLSSFLCVVWWSYRSARVRERNGEVFAPPGKLRWQAEPDRKGSP